MLCNLHIDRQLLENKNRYCKSYMSLLQLIPYIRRSELPYSKKIFAENYFQLLYKKTHNSRPRDLYEGERYFGFNINCKSDIVIIEFDKRKFNIKKTNKDGVLNSEQLEIYLDVVCDDKELCNLIVNM